MLLPIIIVVPISTTSYYVAHISVSISIALATALLIQVKTVLLILPIRLPCIRLLTYSIPTFKPISFFTIDLELLDQAIHIRVTILILSSRCQ